MKKRNFRWGVFLAALMLLVSSVSACGASDRVSDMGTEATNKSSAFTMENMDLEEEVETVNEIAKVDDSRKMIENVELSVQTKEFDTLLEKVNAEIAALNGYIESSNVGGNAIDSENERYAEMRIRIPAEKSQTFSAYISENSVVTNRSVTTEDVTLTYVDMESRVSALKAEKESLEKLLKEASTVQDIMDVRDRLTDVIHEIESYQSQLRTYDNLVDYSTITLYIDEVERTAVVEEQNVWQKIGTNLGNNFANVWDGTVDVFVFVVSAIPYLVPVILIAGIAIAVAVICKRRKQRKSGYAKPKMTIPDLPEENE